MANRKRPGGVTAVAIINIVLGTLALLVGLCSGIVLVAGSDLMQADPNAAAMQDFLRRQLPSHDLVQGAGVGVVLLQGLVFLIAGIGLLNRKNWARIITIVFSILSLL